MRKLAITRYHIGYCFRRIAGVEIGSDNFNRSQRSANLNQKLFTG
jgi:hypothetical protein